MSRGVTATVAAIAAAVAGAGASIASSSTSMSTASGTVQLPAPRIAFVKGNGNPDMVWVASADGHGARRLGRGDDPLISPSGDDVAVSTFGPRGPTLTVYGPGGSHRGWFDARRVSSIAVSWSPEGRYLAVELYSSSGAATSSANRLVVLDLTAGTTRTIAIGYPCGASFSPALPDSLVYAVSPRSVTCRPGHVNLFIRNLADPGATQLTHDGSSASPVWGGGVIAFDRLKARRNDYPVQQIWRIAPDGTGLRQVTHVRVPQLIGGLAPHAISADGEHLLADYSGQDTDEAWTVDMASGRVHRIVIGSEPVTPAGISLDGSTVLVDRGDFLNAPSSGTVETMPFGGARATVLVRHAGRPSWNR